MSAIHKVTRRDFLRDTGIGTGALVLGCHLAGGGMARALFGQEAGTLPELNTFVAIKSDGTIVIMTHRSEMGQGIKTTLPAIVADELEADWSRVVVKQAIGDAKYGNQWTDGSRSVTLNFERMREFGASAKLMLLDAAHLALDVPIEELEAKQHKVWHRASNRSLDYAELAVRAAKLRVPPAEEARKFLKSPDQYRFIGKDMPFWDLGDMVTGRAVYGADVDVEKEVGEKLPAMLTAMIVRCPVVGGKVKRYDPTSTLALPGVVKVWEFEGGGGLGGKFKPLGGVAVFAEHTWAALRGRRELENNIEWEKGPHASYESGAYRAELEASTSQPGRVVRNRGDVDALFGQAPRTVEASYYIPHLAQAPMEPLVATALLHRGELHVWAPTQSPQAAQEVIEEVLGLEHASEHGSAYVPTGKGKDIRVTVHVTLLGGGFGRKSKPDFVAEAAVLAHANPGVPIRVQWTREDDMTAGYYHAVSHQYLKAALDGDGRPTAWLQRVAAPSFVATVSDANATHPGEIELGQGLVDLAFDLPNLRLESCPAPAHTRIGWMRSVANIYHAFAINSFADELARAAGRDPKDYLLELIGEGKILDVDAEIPVSDEVPAYDNYGADKTEFPVDTARLRAVVERVAQEAGWGKQMPASRGLGIAAHRSFLSYVAAVVDASLTGDRLDVNEVHICIDCGFAVNPERVRAQLEGGVIYALSLAVHDDITFTGGAVDQRNFHDYPTLRLNQTPKKIATYVINGGGTPGGVGEPPVPPVAPALTNAIVAAGGPRVRELPLWRKFDFAGSGG